MISLRLRKSLSMILACFLVIGLFPTAMFAAEASGFKDISGHWAEESINKVVEEGLFKGNSESEFAPQGSMTRGMFITVLHRLANKLNGPEVDVQAQTFTDVSSNAWYADAISWAVSAGITDGYGNGKFGPNDELNREQITVLMIRFLSSYLGYDLSSYQASNVFADDASISAWAKEEVYKAAALGLVQGEKGNMFNPKGIASRAVVAVITERLLDKTPSLKGEEPTNIPDSSEETGQTPEPSGTPDLGGGNNTGGSSKVNITAATIQRNNVEVSNAVIRSGDVLSVAVKPANANISVKWLVNGTVKSTDKTYTVHSLDVGSVITAEVTGTGNYISTVTSLPTGKVVASVDLSNQQKNNAPVVVAENATFKDDEGNEFTLSENDVISFSVTASEAEFTEEEKEGVASILQEQFANTDLDIEALSIKYFAIDAELLVESEDSTTTVIHPVGTTTLTLSKASLGFAADVDINKHVFLIGHTNKDNVHENVIGEVVEINGQQYVRVELNGLSTIYIGNVPPLTVSFNTNGGSEIAPVKVKLGEITPEVTAPTKEGHFFIGWNIDLNASPIYMDMLVNALWLEGVYIPEERLTVVDSDGSVIEKQYANGTLTLALTESTEYPASLVYTLNIDAPVNAASYVLCDVAEAAATATVDAAEAVNGPLSVDIEITDADGKIITGKYPQYVKWFDADQNALLLESVTLAVESDVRSATREKTFEVNRGIGTVEAYLLPTSEEDENYVAYVNGYLSGDGIYSNYSLSLNATFQKNNYFPSNYFTIDYKNYNRFNLVFSPFDGESYTGKKPTASAASWNGTESVTVDLAASVNEAGLIEVTLPAGKTLQDLTTDSTNLYLNVIVKLGNVSQSLQLNIYDIYTNTPNNEIKNINTDDWAEVVAALNDKSNQQVYINYYGESVELKSVLTVQETQHLSIQNDLTITSGGEIRLVGGVLGTAGYISVDGDLVIGNKGKITAVKKGNLSGSYYIPGLFVRGTTMVEKGGTLSIPSGSMLSMHSDEKVYVNEGSTFDVSGELMLHNDLVLNTNVGIVGANNYVDYRNGRIELYGDLTINGLLEVSKNASINVSGMTTINEAAELRLAKGNISLNGKTYNYGKIGIPEGILSLSNVGYAVNNYGTIDLGSKATMVLQGTVVVNNGEIKGNGTIELAERVNVAANYDNGIDYVYVEGEQSLSHYDRYQFVKDPEASVTGIIYESKVSGSGTVSNTIKVNEVKIPE